MKLSAPDLRSTATLPNCPLCRSGLHERQDRSCLGCGTGYHLDCLSELGGCSTLGCSSFGLATELVTARPQPQVSCSVCSIEATIRELEPCPGCGEFSHPSCASLGCRSADCPYAERRGPRVGQSSQTSAPEPQAPRSREGEWAVAAIVAGLTVGVVFAILEFKPSKLTVYGVLFASVVVFEACMELRRKFQPKRD